MELFYREVGEGPPMVILHGLFGSSDNWFTQAKMFGEHYHVYLVDQRNHGQSPHSDEHDYTLLAEDLKKFLKDRKIENPIIIGHSMGGKTAMNFALGYPELLSALVVVDIAPKSYPVRHDTIIDGLRALDLTQINSRKEADEALAEHIAEFEVRQFLLKNLQRKQGGGFDWKINLKVLDENIEKMGEGLQYSGSFDKPTLFIRGQKSNYILEEDYDRIHEIFENATIVSLDASHWVQAEKPQEFVDTVLAFIKDHG
jgi:pimeloyl-ACP methyl ester carboxylesterase